MMKKTTAEKTWIWLCPSHSGSDSESHTAPTTESSRHEITPRTRFTVPLHQSFPFAGRKSVGWRSAIRSATIDTTTRERKLPGGSSHVFEMVGSFGRAGHSLSWTQ